MAAKPSRSEIHDVSSSFHGRFGPAADGGCRRLRTRRLLGGRRERQAGREKERGGGAPRGPAARRPGSCRAMQRSYFSSFSFSPSAATLMLAPFVALFRLMTTPLPFLRELTSTPLPAAAPVPAAAYVPEKSSRPFRL